MERHGSSKMPDAAWLEIPDFTVRSVLDRYHPERLAPIFPGITHNKQRRVTALFYSCLVRLFVDIVSLVLGVDDLLALVETKVARQHIAERDGEKEIRHTVISKQLKADEQ